MRQACPVQIPLRGLLLSALTLGGGASAASALEIHTPGAEAHLAAAVGGSPWPGFPQELDVQTWLDRAESGEVLQLAAGTYTGPLRIDKPVTLRGGAGVVIQGPGEGDVIQINAPAVVLRGLTIRGTGDSLDQENAGIVITAPRVTIEDCRLEDVLFGIYAKEAPECVLRGNTIGAKDLPEPRRGDGIRLWQSPNSLIEGNRIVGSRDVIMWFSDDVLLRDNHVTHGRYGLHFMYSSRNVLEDNILTDNSVGAFLMYSSDLTVRRNLFARNRGPSGFGLGLKDLDGLVAEDNLFVGNRVGLHLDNSPSSVGVKHLLRRNVIGFNDVGVAFLPMVEGNRFTENTFLENIEQIGILGAGELRGNDFVVDGRGNYWSDYRGYDLDGDGIGDLEYRANSLFENLIDREPRLRLFLYSPAQHALTMAARAFPVVALRTKIIDPAPLLDPVYAGIDLPSQAAGPSLGAGGGLLVLGLMCLVPGLAGGRRRLGLGTTAADLEETRGEQA